MLSRALRLREAIDTWTSQKQLDPVDWERIKYLVDASKIFIWITNWCGEYNYTGVHSNILMLKVAAKHLEKVKDRIRLTPMKAWKRELIFSIESAEKKLSKYIKIIKRDFEIYAAVVLLNPPRVHSDTRWTSAKSLGWNDDDTYEQECKRLFVQIYQSNYHTGQQPQPEEALRMPEDILTESILSPAKVDLKPSPVYVIITCNNHM